jgi:PKD repeat protein
MRSLLYPVAMYLLTAFCLQVLTPTVASAEDGDGSYPPDLNNWCGTQKLFDEKVQDLGLPSDPNACPQRGACDDPGLRDQWLPDSLTGATFVRLVVHILHNSDGSNPITTEEEVQEHIDALNAEYLPSALLFEHSVNHVYSTAWRTLSEGEINAMKSATAVKPDSQLNVWVTTVDFGYSFGTFPWDSDALTSRGGIVMGHFHWVGGPYSTFAHEVGHCIGLYHTFNGVDEVDQCGTCYETPNAQDRNVLGDRCADTPPGPTHNSCSNAPGSDPCSGVPWGYTMPENIMGYTPSSCRRIFTNQQGGRMLCWLNDELEAWTVGVRFAGAPTFGEPPMTVDFSSESSKPATEYLWEFGDGNTSDESDPSHHYTTAGYHTVSLTIQTADGPYINSKQGYVSLHADTLQGIDIIGQSGRQVRVNINAHNYLPLNEMTIPVSWDGPFNLSYDSISTEGLRTEYFEVQNILNFDTFNKRLVIYLKSSSGGALPYLAPDTGAVVSLYFLIPSFVKTGINPIDILSYGTYEPKFVATAGSYNPTAIAGSIGVSCCKNLTGNVDNDFLDQADLGDLTKLIDYLFISFEPPECMAEANVDGDPEGLVDLSDLTRLIDYLFISFSPLEPCQ